MCKLKFKKDEHKNKSENEAKFSQSSRLLRVKNGNNIMVRKCQFSIVEVYYGTMFLQEKLVYQWLLSPQTAAHPPKTTKLHVASQWFCGNTRSSRKYAVATDGVIGVREYYKFTNEKVSL